MAARHVDGMSGRLPRTASSGLTPRQIFSTFWRRESGVSATRVFSASISCISARTLRSTARLLFLIVVSDCSLEFVLIGWFSFQNIRCVVNRGRASARGPAARLRGSRDGGGTLTRPGNGGVVGRTADNGSGQADCRPGVVDGSLHVAAVAVELSGNVDGGLHEVREIRLGLQPLRERGVPDPPQHLPRLAA